MGRLLRRKRLVVFGGFRPQHQHPLLPWSAIGWCERHVCFDWCCSFEDVACLGESSSLSELSLDGNPFAQDGAYKQMILRNMATLKQLDMRKITVRTAPHNSASQAHVSLSR